MNQRLAKLHQTIVGWCDCYVDAGLPDGQVRARLSRTFSAGRSLRSPAAFHSSDKRVSLRDARTCHPEVPAPFSRAEGSQPIYFP